MPNRIDVASGTLNGNTPLRVELIETNRANRQWSPSTGHQPQRAVKQRS
jgi:hypothetical protein